MTTEHRPTAIAEAGFSSQEANVIAAALRAFAASLDAADMVAPSADTRNAARQAAAMGEDFAVGSSLAAAKAARAAMKR